MLRVPFRVGVVSVFGAWLSTLGACGRTLPGLEDAYGDDDIYDAGTGGSSRGGSSARGGSGAVSTGGSNRGGTSSSVGGSTVSEGGSTIGVGGPGVSVGGSNRGGTGFGGSTNAVGGSVSTGGTAGDIATGGTAGDLIITVGGTGNTVGGTGNVPGTGGAPAAGFGGIATTGGSGGTGAAAGTSSMPPGGIKCGDSVCDPADTVCCSRRSQPSYCTYPGSECQGAMLACSGPSTCAAGEVCCFHFLSSVCSETCDVSVGAPGTPPTIILCDSTADCGPNQTCVVAPRGIAYCGDNL